jgi:hypothetical protein
VSGPYAYTRNPLYLGSMIMAAAFALAARSFIIAVIIVLMFLLIYLPVIHGEEEFLGHLFPGDFERYRFQVPRFIPDFSTRPVDRRGSLIEGFSRQLYCQHREYNALIGAIVLLAALAAKVLWASGKHP